VTARWIEESYPSKQWLSRSEAMHVLKDGPLPKWFEPWAAHGVLFAGLTEHGYGYVHVHGSGGALQCDVATWTTQDGLNWGLQDLHMSHSRCDECQGVLYFAPDEPLRLRLVVEVDDEEDDQ
jgi:hypothetical protein